MKTLMYTETLESAKTIAHQWAENRELRLEICKSWKEFNPYTFLTIARGSSDHAAQYFNYLASLKLGKITTSFTPSLISIYEKSIDASKTISIGISQSGRSPDLIAVFKSLREKKFPSLAMVNVENSPLADEASFVYPLRAGEEKSVAATKSFIASLFASASLIGEYSQDKSFLVALAQASQTLERESISPWSKIIDLLSTSEKTMIVGRGLGLSIALEASLKLKETCHIQAEAFSAAEILHGPQAVIEEKYPLIIFALRGECQKALFDLGQMMKERGANVIVISDQQNELTDCLYKTSSHIDLDPINAIHQFYITVEALALAKGLNPDQPRSLSKVTLTI